MGNISDFQEKSSSFSYPFATFIMIKFAALAAISAATVGVTMPAQVI